MARLLAPDRPDWRWARVAELSQYSNTAALARLQDEDELTRQAYEFRRALDRGMRAKFEAHDAAYEIFMNRRDLRLQVEGMIIAGASNEQVADAAFIPDTEVVEVYHDTFFWVRPGLNKPAWLNSVVFGGLPHMNSHLNDTSGTVLRLARKIGPEAFRDLIDGGLSADTTVTQLRRMTNEVLLAQMAMFSFAAGSGRDMPEWMGKLIEKKEADVSQGGGEMDKALDSFFSGLAISVADPTDERNLSLPAREARVADYEVVNNGR